MKKNGTPGRDERPGNRGEFSKFAWMRSMAGRPGLTATQWYALAEAFNKADENGKDIFLGYESLAAKSGMSTASAKRALKSLCELGVIRRTARGGRAGDGRKWASAYELVFSTDHRSHVDPVEVPASTDHVSHLENSVNGSSECSQGINPAPQGITGDHPIDPLPTHPLPLDPPGGSLALRNAGASAREDAQTADAELVPIADQPTHFSAFSDMFTATQPAAAAPRPTSITEERLNPYVDTFDGMSRGTVPKLPPRPGDPFAPWHEEISPSLRVKLTRLRLSEALAVLEAHPTKAELRAYFANKGTAA